MEKIAYVFTNGISAELVVLINEKFEGYVDTEYLNNRVFSEVLLPNKLTRYYATYEELEKNNYPVDEDGYFIDMISVFDDNGNEYFLDDEKLIIKNATQKDLQSWNSLYWCEIVEFD